MALITWIRLKKKQVFKFKVVIDQGLERYTQEILTHVWPWGYVTTFLDFGFSVCRKDVCTLVREMHT